MKYFTKYIISFRLVESSITKSVKEARRKFKIKLFIAKQSKLV